MKCEDVADKGLQTGKKYGYMTQIWQIEQFFKIK